MITIIDLDRVARLSKISKYVSVAGIVLLLIGLILVFTNIDPSQVFVLQLSAMFGGWLLAQIGIYLAHRYVREPRPDEVLDDAVRKVTPGGRMYHYVLPAPHVLLMPSGVIVFVAKYQVGRISVEGDRWRQKGIGLARFFGQQGLGNPSREAQIQVEKLANYIRKHAPSVEELPIAPIIVFTTKGLKTLDVANSDIPALHYTKLRGYLKQQRLNQKPMPASDYQALRDAFDAAAGRELLASAEEATAG